MSQDGQSSDEEDEDDHSDYEGGNDQNYEDISVDPKDEEAFEAFMNPEKAARKTLAELVIFFKSDFVFYHWMVIALVADL